MQKIHFIVSSLTLILSAALVQLAHAQNGDRYQAETSHVDKEQEATQNMALNFAPQCAGNNVSAASLSELSIFAQFVCSRPDLLTMLQRIDALAQKLRLGLPALWRVSFNAQQAALFKQIMYACVHSEKPTMECIVPSIKQRLQELEGLAAHLDNPLPDCKSSEIRIKNNPETTYNYDMYLLEYQGNTACQVRGYPTVFVSSDEQQKTSITISYEPTARQAAALVDPPLPVVLSPQNKTGWFEIHNANTCTPRSKFTLKVALPLSQTELLSLQYDGQYLSACPNIIVTPIDVMSNIQWFFNPPQNYRYQ